MELVGDLKAIHGLDGETELATSYLCEILGKDQQRSCKNNLHQRRNQCF